MNLGTTELIIILVIILIVFGAGRLPQVMESLGSGVKKFRQAQKDEPKDVSDDEAPKAIDSQEGVEDAHVVKDEQKDPTKR